MCMPAAVGFRVLQVAVAVFHRMDLSKHADKATTAQRFARALHDSWGVGNPDCQNGALLLLAVGDRQVRGPQEPWTARKPCWCWTMLVWQLQQPQDTRLAPTCMPQHRVMLSLLRTQPRLCGACCCPSCSVEKGVSTAAAPACCCCCCCCTGLHQHRRGHQGSCVRGAAGGGPGRHQTSSETQTVRQERHRAGRVIHWCNSTRPSSCSALLAGSIAWLSTAHHRKLNELCPVPRWALVDGTPPNNPVSSCTPAALAVPAGMRKRSCHVCSSWACWRLASSQTLVAWTAMMDWASFCSSSAALLPSWAGRGSATGRGASATR